MIKIIEIKAKCKDSAGIRSILLDLNAEFIGSDHQIDTYFKVPFGRLKLRQGSIENALIQYQRSDQKGPKLSEVKLFPVKDADALRMILEASLGILVTVDKRRDIFFIENVKFHLDEVEGLGRFVEIEAIDQDGSRDLPALTVQCNHYLKRLGISEQDMVRDSYSDQLIQLPT